MKWLPFELHCHTYHSDGKQSLSELANGAKSLGMRGVALTDHNTMTGLGNREEVMWETGLEIIRGLEWTTFFGHMLTIGINHYVDWRNLSPFHIGRGVELVHEQGGVCGVAHPFRVGSPMCTGCFWEFEVSDWSMIDFIEVWSGLFPSIQNTNARAFALWTELLNKGVRISATSGRDWHVAGEVTEPVCATFLGVDGEEGNLEQNAVEALRRGAVCVSMGPVPFLTAADDQGNNAEVGDVLHVSARASALHIHAGFDGDARKGHWKLPEQTMELRLMSNQGVLKALEVSMASPSTTVALEPAGLIWMRAELYGIMQGVRTMIGFTNPIYFEINH